MTFFNDWFGKRRTEEPETFGDLIARKPNRRESGVCNLRFHLLCTGRAQDGGRCRCQHHEVTA